MKNDHNVVSIFSLYNGSFYIMKVAPESEITIFLQTIYIKSTICWISAHFSQALLFFLFYFELCITLSNLSDHMKQQDKPRLTPYTGEITSDETGDLANFI